MRTGNESVKTIKSGLLAALFMLSSVFATFAAAAEKKLIAGAVQFPWGDAYRIDGGTLPKSVTNLTFPFIIWPETLRKRVYYLAQQYYFTGKYSECGYLGLQPIEDANGKRRMQAIFSSFNPEATPVAHNCRPGADGGKGVSCALEFEAEYRTRYDITIHKTGDHIWSGELLNTRTGKVLHIGSYKLPKESGDLRLAGVGFLEHYTGSFKNCQELEKIRAAFGPVYSQDSGGIVAKLGKMYYGQSTPTLHACSSAGEDSGDVSTHKHFTLTFNNPHKSVDELGWYVQRGFVLNPIHFSAQHSQLKLEPDLVRPKKCSVLALYANDAKGHPIDDAQYSFTFAEFGPDNTRTSVFYYFGPDDAHAGRYSFELCDWMKTEAYAYKLGDKQGRLLGLTVRNPNYKKAAIQTGS